MFGRGFEGGGGGGLREGQLGGGGPGGPIWGGDGGAQAPLTFICPPSNHSITIDLTLTFAASWFGHAWAEQDPQKFAQGCFCHIIALHSGPLH